MYKQTFKEATTITIYKNKQLNLTWSLHVIEQ